MRGFSRNSARMSATKPPQASRMSFAPGFSAARVLVVIPCWNEARNLAEVVRELRSARSGDDILVVDDGSTDDTREVVAELGDDVRYVYRANGGPAAARNVGARCSRGRYLAFLDSDDRWLPGGHQRLLELLEANPGVAVGFGDVRVGNRREGYFGLIEMVGGEGFRAHVVGFHLPAFSNTGIECSALLQAVQLPEAEPDQKDDTGDGEQGSPPIAAAKELKKGVHADAFLARPRRAEIGAVCAG